ncbi:MAG: hypothetical protein ACXWJK_12060, partial [Burkholderiaceae bacterium]
AVVMPAWAMLAENSEANRLHNAAHRIERCIIDFPLLLFCMPPVVRHALLYADWHNRVCPSICFDRRHHPQSGFNVSAAKLKNCHEDNSSL